MKELVRFSAEEKKMTGKSVARSLRTEGKIPVTLYGGTEAPEMFAIPFNTFYKEYIKGGIKTRPVELDLGARKISAITRDVQIHPVTDAPLHVDFLRVGKDTIVEVLITIHVINEDRSPGIRKGGVANIVKRKVPFYCHPARIPHHIEIDIGDLEIGQVVHMHDITLPEGVRPVDSSNFTVLTLIGRTEEVEKAAGAATADTATTGEATPSA